MKKNLLILLILSLSPLLLNAETLRIEISELTKEPNKYKIIDTREKDIFSKNHIIGALNFPVNRTYENKDINGKVLDPTKMQAIVRSLGLNINDSIVVYDDGIFYDAARLFWTLEVYGFKNVKILNAGFNEWQRKELPISNEIKKVKPSNYISVVNNERLSTKFTTQIATKNPNQIIIDARGYESYIGKKSVAKRFGHIPKAIHIPAIYNLDTKEAEKKLKNTNELKNLYKDIDKNKKIVIYCAIGRVASTNYFALRELGYNVSNYDASWKEWGNNFFLPIVNKSKK